MKKIALGEPVAVPAGQYAKQVLTNLGIYDAVNAKAVLAKDVRQVLTYVETGNVDAGIVYSTDALSSSKVKVVATAPANSHDPVIYPAAVIKDSKNAAAARAFLDFLLQRASDRHLQEIRIHAGRLIARIGMNSCASRHEKDQPGGLTCIISYVRSRIFSIDSLRDSTFRDRWSATCVAQAIRRVLRVN